MNKEVSTTKTKKRIKKKKILPSQPNVLLIKWLQEWKKEAEDKVSKVQYTYNKALKSLKKYPLPLRSGKECLILENFGKKICDMIDEKISQHSAETGLEVWEMFAESSSPPKTSKRAAKTTNNVPRKKSEKCPRLVVHTISSSDESDDETAMGTEGAGSEEVTVLPALPPPPSSPPHPPIVQNVQSLTSIKPKSGSFKPKEYVPKYRSGAYAVLLTLLQSHKEDMTKEELICEAQPLSETSFKSVAGTYYTAWSSVRTLIQKEFVAKHSNPAKYSLTTSGQSLALKLSQSAPSSCTVTTQYIEPTAPAPTLPSHSKTCQTFNEPFSNSNGSKPENNIALNDIVCIDDDDDGVGASDDDANDVVKYDGNGNAEVLPDIEPSNLITDSTVVLKPHTFDIVLLVDNCEYYGSSNANKPLVTELVKNGVHCMLRKLNAGDFIWIARSKNCEKPMELVLNYIVERKRMDDLSGSIVDGRFREQKFRLKQSGLSHPIYLIEDYGSVKHFSVSEDKLIQAITNTQVIDGFFVKRTGNTKESVAYLTILTRYLQSYYLKKTLYGSNEVVKIHPGGDTFNNLDAESEILCNFEDFNNSVVKSKVLTVREMFAKQLIHLPNMSGPKAFAITEKWPTPASLYEAYKACPDTASQEQMLSKLRTGKSNRNFGPVLSRKIQQFFCSDE